jgi:hypothetical protein
MGHAYFFTSELPSPTFGELVHRFTRLIISLHLSACSHQSRHDFSFSGLTTSLLHVSHVPTSSSLQISTFPPQLGHGKYSGTGRTNFLMPGQVSKFDLNNIFHLSKCNVSVAAGVTLPVDTFLFIHVILFPFMLIVSCLKDVAFPEESKASLTRRYRPKQHGTSMLITVTLLMLFRLNISVSFFL